MSFFKTNKRKIPPPPSTVIQEPTLLDEDHDKPASNGGHGTDDTLRVTQILEEHGIPCCLVGISALMFYGAARVRPDWEICVPTDLVDKARELLRSEPYTAEYCLVDPWAHFDPGSLVHTYSRFKSRDTDHYFVLVPSVDVHIHCSPFDILRSIRGLPYPSLAVFIQSCLDRRSMVELDDVVDGTDVSEHWGEENLQLGGTNDVEWARDLNQRGEDFDGGRFAHWGPFVPDAPRSRREMWQEVVRTKDKRLDWTKPRDIFVTQHRLVDEPDSWTVLSDMY